MKRYKVVKSITLMIILTIILGSLLIFYLQSKEQHRLNILLITIDSLRPDRLGCYGYKRNTSPNIDKLAQDGVVFTQTIAPASFTAPSMVSILTGALPFIHKVDNWGIYIPSELISLPELLKAKGYFTSFFSSCGVLGALMGFDDRFNTFHSMPTYYPAGPTYKFTQTIKITDEIIKWIDKNKIV